MPDVLARHPARRATNNMCLNSGRGGVKRQWLPVGVWLLNFRITHTWPVCQAAYFRLKLSRCQLSVCTLCHSGNPKASEALDCQKLRTVALERPVEANGSISRGVEGISEPHPGNAGLWGRLTHPPADDVLMPS